MKINKHIILILLFVNKNFTDSQIENYNDFYIESLGSFHESQKLDLINKKENNLVFYKKTYKSFMMDNPSEFKKLAYKLINEKKYYKYYIGAVSLLSFYSIKNLFLYPFVKKIDDEIEKQPGGSKKIIFEKIEKNYNEILNKNNIDQELLNNFRSGLIENVKEEYKNYCLIIDDFIKEVIIELKNRNQTIIDRLVLNFVNNKNSQENKNFLNKLIDSLYVKNKLIINNSELFLELNMQDFKYKLFMKKDIDFDNGNIITLKNFITTQTHNDKDFVIDNKLDLKIINDYIKKNLNDNFNKLLNTLYEIYTSTIYEYQNKTLVDFQKLISFFDIFSKNLFFKNKKNYIIDFIHNLLRNKLDSRIGANIFTNISSIIINVPKDSLLEEFKRNNIINNVSKYKYNNNFHFYCNELVNNTNYTLLKLTGISVLSANIYLLGNKIFRKLFPDLHKYPPLEIYKPGNINVLPLKDIGGLFIIKNEFLDIVNKVNSRTNSSIKEGMGMILYGGSETGKTLSAKILSKELGYSMMYVDSASIIPNENSTYTIHNALNHIFETAKNIGNCVILFDEFDRIIKTQEVLSEVLRLLDNYLKTTNIIFIATTNNINNFDEALLRPGRLNRVIFVDLPSINERIDIFNKIFESYKFTIKDKKLFEYFGKITQGFSSAMIIELMSNIQDIILQFNVSTINKNVFDNAYIKVILGEQYKGLKIDKEFKNKTSSLMAAELYHAIRNDIDYPYNIAFATINAFEKNYRDSENFSGTIKKIYKNELNKNKTEKKLEIEIESLIIKIAMEDLYFNNKLTSINKDREYINKLISELIILKNGFINNNEAIEKSEEIYSRIYEKVYKLINTEEYKRGINSIYKLLNNNVIVFGNEILSEIKK